MLPLATIWMDLEGIMFSEISQVEKDKLLYDITYIIKKRIRLTDTENKLVVTSGETGKKMGEIEVEG